MTNAGFETATVDFVRRVVYLLSYRVTLSSPLLEGKLFNCLAYFPTDPIESMKLLWLHWCGQYSLNSRSNVHCNEAVMVSSCKLTRRGTMRTNDPSA